MAFANKIGNLFKNAINSNPSIYQSIRCMSSSKLFIGGISYSTDDHSLREAFTGYGEVIEARVIVDRETGRSRGFGFVTFTSSEEASAAMGAMDGKELHGRVVRVNYANDRSSGGGFRGGGYGGGYGGGGGGGYGSTGGYGGGGYDSSSRNYGGGYGDGSGGGNYGGGNYSGGGGVSNSYGTAGYGGGSNYGSDSVAGHSGANYASSDSGVPGYNSGAGAYSNSIGGDTYGNSTADDVYGKEANFMDDTKNDDYEPDDYANKRS